MAIHADFSIQGQFIVNSAGTVYNVTIARDRTKNTPDLSPPDPTDNTWYVHHHSGSLMKKLSIQNLSDTPIHFSYSNGERWSTLLNKGAQWEGNVNIKFFMVKADVGGSLFQFTASGV